MHISTEIRVVVADACNLMVSAIMSNLTGPSDAERGHSIKPIKISGMANNYPALIDSILDTRPHVVIMDDRLDLTKPALMMLRQAKEAVDSEFYLVHRVRWIVIGSHYRPPMVAALMAAGCDGYLYRADNMQNNLLSAVLQVVAGSPYLSAQPSSAGVEALRQMDKTGSEVLTFEEEELLRAMADDLDTDDICERFDWSKSFVYHKTRELRERFGKQSNEGLIAAVCLQGVIRLDMFPGGLTRQLRSELVVEKRVRKARL